MARQRSLSSLETGAAELDDGVAQFASLAGETKPLSQGEEQALFLRKDNERLARHVFYYGQ
ncbi:hypothetical protein BOTU111921_05315 [Bordetella tumbae]